MPVRSRFDRHHPVWRQIHEKTLIVTALSGVFVTAAHAQSSVTLYGLIDAGITYTNNQGWPAHGRNAAARSTAAAGDLRGTEDLGGGLKAIFVLENGFNIANGTLGQNGREFGRQAFVGLSHDQFGAVTLGRQYDSVVDYIGPLSLTGTQFGGTQFAHPFDNDNLNNSFRINNAVKYERQLRRSEVRRVVRLLEQQPVLEQSRVQRGRITYAGFNIGAGYLQLNNDISGLTSAAVTNSGGAVAGDNVRRQASARVRRRPELHIRPGNGRLRVHAIAREPGARHLRGGLGRVEWAGSRRHVCPLQQLRSKRPLRAHAGLVAGRVVHIHRRLPGRPSSGWNQFNLQTDYALSKRTDVYVQGVYQRVSTDGRHRRLCQWPRWCFIDQQADRGHSRPAPSLLSDR